MLRVGDLAQHRKAALRGSTIVVRDGKVGQEAGRTECSRLAAAFARDPDGELKTGDRAGGGQLGARRRPAPSKWCIRDEPARLGQWRKVRSVQPRGRCLDRIPEQAFVAQQVTRRLDHYCRSGDCLVRLQRGGRVAQGGEDARDQCCAVA